MEAILLTYKYWLILPLAIIEGPIVAMAAAFLASTGVLNIQIVYGLALAGDIIGDILYYTLGRYGGEPLIDKYGRYIKVTQESVEKVKQKYFTKQKSLWQVITISKAMQAPSSIILVICGLTGVNFREFFVITTVANIVKVLFFVLIGFYFGRGYMLVDQYLRYSWVLLIPLIVGAVWYWKKGR
jgi:membrane-associated protein